MTWTAQPPENMNSLQTTHTDRDTHIHIHSHRQTDSLSLSGHHPRRKPKHTKLQHSIATGLLLITSLPRIRHNTHTRRRLTIPGHSTPTTSHDVTRIPLSLGVSFFFGSIRDDEREDTRRGVDRILDHV
ncbi:hypothetical protein KC19_4G260500 [Ceratodon purpureus]|uniref:Uncharacterized protein n=1 Tax=Ceratodon purpureus TaxID=3225 RepID=A0A8T0ICS8_CERPU|nr:hypothetical protein KC19_4G260500 [Ceratodon purpureus]